MVISEMAGCKIVNAGTAGFMLHRSKTYVTINDNDCKRSVRNATCLYRLI